jgi:glycosyltransferase involved in cell wall biosynthesis
VVVTPNGVDPAFTPGNSLSLGTYVLAVGAVQPRKNHLAALAAAEAVPLPLVVAGPVKDEGLATQLRDAGADLRGYVSQEELAELYRGAACLVQASHFEGFGLPMLEAMASGTPVVALDEPALREVGGDAAVFVEEANLAEGMRLALAEHDQRAAAGLERARAFSWRVTRRRRSTSIGRRSDERLGDRRLAWPRTRARAVAAGAGAAGRRARGDRERSGQRRRAPARGACAREPTAAHVSLRT